MKFLSFFLLLSFFFAACNDSTSEKNMTTADADVKTSCVLSQLAYCSAPGELIEKHLPGWKIVWNPEAVNGNYAFIASNGTTYALAIRGSLLEFSWNAFQNWFYQDLNIAEMKRWAYTNSKDKGEIAQGAYNGWMNLNLMKDKRNGQFLFPFLDSVTKTDTPLLITGHSLGGNLATVYASNVWQHFNTVNSTKAHMNVITFGAPAAGDKLFAADFETKFPNAVRIENTNDIVSKFPCKGKIADLGNLFSSSLAASKITVGYNNLTTSLDKVFDLMNAALVVLAIKNGGNAYTQPIGHLITVPLSGKNQKTNIDDWLKEAAYHHSMEQYAKSLGLPVISCNNKSPE